MSIVGEGATHSKMEGNASGTTLYGDGLPMGSAILNFSGGSGNENTGVVQGIAFRASADGVDLVGVRVLGACGVKIRDCDFAKLRVGIHFSNNQPGAFTEYSVAENCSFASNLVNSVLYERGLGLDSFHGTGLKGCRINRASQSCEAAIQVGALADGQIKLYNAPMDFQIWTNYVGCTNRDAIRVLSDPSSIITTYGSITVEQFGLPGSVAGGLATVFHAGSVLSNGTVTLGNLQMVDFLNINPNGSLNVIPKSYHVERQTNGAASMNVLSLGTFSGELGALLLVRVSASNYEFRCLLSTAHNGYGNPGYANILQTFMDLDNRGFGDPNFSVTSNGDVTIGNPNYSGNDLNVQIHVMPSGGKKESFLK